MFLSFSEFKEFPSAGKHAAGNKQIQSIIATSPAVTEVVVVEF